MKNSFLVVFFLAFICNISAQKSVDPFTNRILLNPIDAPFYHGVASGDALNDRVIIWTRVTPDSSVTGPIAVSWKMATDTNFIHIINQGNTTADYHRDYTVKVDVTGLQPNTWYYYSFTALGKNSVIGRTKTTPVGDNDSIRFAVVTGSDYNAGYFNAYFDIARRNDIDAVLHLGDYIYEYETNGYGNNPDRGLEPPTEIIDTSDYRIRYAHYRLDPDLRYLHQQYPWYLIWDDHETANNSYKGGAENHNPATEGSWYARRDGAIEAYLEWIPIREHDVNEPLKIYRNVHFGNLLDLYFLETRYLARDDPSMSISDPNKTMMGQVQYDWLTNSLDSSQARWKVLANQVMMAPLATIGQITVNTDQWDGYPAERSRLLNFVVNDSINNFVVLTGDIHTSWGNDLMYEAGTLLNPESYKSAGAEFITPSISSPSTNSFLGGLGSTMLTLLLPHIQYSNIDKRGYMIFNLTKTRAQADWYLMPNDDIAQYHVYNNAFDDSWYLPFNKTDRKIVHDGSASHRTGYMPPLVSAYPYGYVGKPEYQENGSSSLGVYPNPCTKSITLVFYNYYPKNISFSIVDINGQSVIRTHTGLFEKGIHYQSINTASLKAGMYFIIAESDNRVEQKTRFIKE
ncbi:MAG: alkaline phosphatase D family protein [Bacteroidota bacterium]